MSTINLAKAPVSRKSTPEIKPELDGQRAMWTGKAGEITSSHRKDKDLTRAYCAVVRDADGYTRKLVEIRIYQPRETVYACCWIGSAGIHTSGSGKAGGAGYCKPSAAADMAIRNAGWRLEKSIDSAGLYEIERAVQAIATALGYPDALLVVTHP